VPTIGVATIGTRGRADTWGVSGGACPIDSKE
jgi:hypothetical protein